MKYKIFDAHPDHIEEINYKECYSKDELECVRELIAAAKVSGNSLAVSIKNESGKVVGLVGSYKLWTGCSQIWAIFDREVDDHPVSLAKVCHNLIRYAATTQDLRRMSMNVRSHYEKGNRFAEFLGFDFEGKMWGYLPDGGDANLYARLF
jgi:hypothetical protein